MKAARFRARDNARTPMQWDATENAGFTNGIPWMRVNPNYLTINAAAQMADENSILSYYKQLLSIRKQHDVFVYGRYELTDASNPAVYSFLRILEDEELLVLCNFTAQEAKVAVPADFLKSGVSLLLGNYSTHPEPLKAEISIRPYEARIYLRKKTSRRKKHLYRKMELPYENEQTTTLGSRALFRPIDIGIFYWYRCTISRQLLLFTDGLEWRFP